MPYSPILIFHICAGTVGLLSGGVTMTFRKGSRGHRLAGDVFCVAMLCMGSAGAYMALTKSQMGNVFGGVLTCYLVTTAWLTARRRDGGTGIFDWAAMLAALAVGATIVSMGVAAARSPTGIKDGVPAGMYFVMGSMALLCAAGDIRMIVRGGIFGAQRVARHLWRMCFAFFFATGSIFIARPHLFPLWMSKTYTLVFLGVLPLLLMIFWLFRVLLARRVKGVRVRRWEEKGRVEGLGRA